MKDHIMIPARLYAAEFGVIMKRYARYISIDVTTRVLHLRRRVCGKSQQLNRSEL